MAEDWKTMHTFSNGEIMLASYFEDMRENLDHIKQPRYGIARGKLVDQSINLGSAAIGWSAYSTTYIDSVIINTSGRDVLLVANPTGRPTTSSTAVISFGFHWDGVPVYGSSDGATSGQITGAHTLDQTVPIFHVLSAPSEGEHTLQLMYRFSPGTGGKAVLLAARVRPGGSGRHRPVGLRGEPDRAPPRERGAACPDRAAAVTP